MTDGETATDLIHNKLNDGLEKYKQIIINELDVALDSYPVPGAYMTTSHREGIQVLEYSKEQNIVGILILPQILILVSITDKYLSFCISLKILMVDLLCSELESINPKQELHYSSHQIGVSHTVQNL